MNSTISAPQVPPAASSLALRERLIELVTEAGVPTWDEASKFNDGELIQAVVNRRRALLLQFFAGCVARELQRRIHNKGLDP